MAAPARASLDRRLGPFDAAAIVISNVIGVGIFTTPGFIATLLPSGIAILGVWALGGALAFAGALAYAELAARQPEAGGEYVYLREAFGGLAAFLTGWTSFVAGFSGAIAAGGVGIAAYLDRLVPGAGNGAPLAGVAPGSARRERVGARARRDRGHPRPRARADARRRSGPRAAEPR